VRFRKTAQQASAINTARLTSRCTWAGEHLNGWTRRQSRPGERGRGGDPFSATCQHEHGRELACGEKERGSDRKIESRLAYNRESG